MADPAVQAAAESAAEVAFFQARADHTAPVWDCVVAAVHASLAAAAPLIRRQAFTEAADRVKAECSHGDMHYGNFDPDRCPICTHFIAALRGLDEGTS